MNDNVVIETVLKFIDAVKRTNPVGMAYVIVTDDNILSSIVASRETNTLLAEHLKLMASKLLEIDVESDRTIN